jgi:hypothetical protein
MLELVREISAVERYARQFADESESLVVLIHSGKYHQKTHESLRRRAKQVSVMLLKLAETKNL